MSQFQKNCDWYICYFWDNSQESQPLNYLEFFFLVFPVKSFPCAARVLLNSMSATSFFSPFGAEHGPGILTTSLQCKKAVSQCQNTPYESISLFSWRWGQFIALLQSSPTRTRTWNLVINSHLQLPLCYEGIRSIMLPCVAWLLS